HARPTRSPAGTRPGPTSRPEPQNERAAPDPRSGAALPVRPLVSRVPRARCVAFCTRKVPDHGIWGGQRYRSRAPRAGASVGSGAALGLTEDGLDDAVGGVPVLQAAEPLAEGGQPVGVPGLEVAQARDGVDDLVA